MNKKNKFKLTLISFFSYSFTGALVIVTGVLLKSISEYFNLPVSTIGNTFTLLNTGILISIMLNVWLMSIFSLNKQLIFSFILMIISIYCLIIGKTLITISISMFILGLISGSTMSIGTYLITYLYSGKQRGSLLLIADSFFSMAGILFPIIAGNLLSKNITWYWVYIYISLLYFMIFILTITSEFPMLELQKININKCSNKNEKFKWPGVIILSISALFYILGQLSFISWVPEYTISKFNFNIQQASNLVSTFWISYMVGMWVFSIILPMFNLHRILIVLSIFSSIFMYCFIHTKNISNLFYFLVALGFFSSAIYTIIITLGSQQTKSKSPKLVNFILTCGTIGTMLIFVVTGPIVENYGVIAALKMSNILYFMVFILCLIFNYINRNNFIKSNFNLKK